jgi:hypothetical protein
MAASVLSRQHAERHLTQRLFRLILGRVERLGHPTCARAPDRGECGEGETRWNARLGNPQREED